MFRRIVPAMTSFTFQCPNSGLLVQSWAEPPKTATDYYEAVQCTACQRVHFVSPRTGKVIGTQPIRTSAK